MILKIKANKLTTPKNILIILPGPMGDMILAGPALRQLRKSCNDATITFMASSVGKAIYDGCDYYDHWITSDKADKLSEIAKKLRDKNFDAAILLQNSFRSAILAKKAKIHQIIGYNRDGRKFLLTHRINPIKIQKRFAVISMHAYYSHLMDFAIGSLGNTPVPTSNKMELFTTATDITNTDKLFNDWHIDSEKLIVMVPGGAFGGSKWWPGENFAILADKLAQNNYQIMLSCAPNDPERKVAQQIIENANCKIYNLLDAKIDLGTVKEIINRSRLLISNDTGPCHIAAAFGTPLVTIFGPTDPRWTATGYQKEIRLRIDTTCGPCQQSICATDHRCMNIDVDTVYDAACTQLLGQSLKFESIIDKPFQIYNESYLPLKDNSGLIHEHFKTFLEQNKLSTINEIFQSEITTLPYNNTTLNIKRFKNKKGTDEFVAAMHNQYPAIKTDRPVAFGQQKNLIGTKRSFVISQQLPKIITADIQNNAKKLRKHFDPDNNLDLFIFKSENFKTDNLDKLIESVAQKIKNQKVSARDFRILVISSDDYSDYFAQAKKLGLQNKILFIGSTAQTTALELMANQTIKEF